MDIKAGRELRPTPANCSLLASRVGGRPKSLIAPLFCLANDNIKPIFSRFLLSPKGWISISAFALIGGSLVSLKVSLFCFGTDEIKRYSPGFFFLTRNAGLRYGPLDGSNVPELSISVTSLSNVSRRARYSVLGATVLQEFARGIAFSIQLNLSAA